MENISGQRAKSSWSQTEITEVVEMDKMHSCIGQKTAAGYGLLLIDMAKDSSILATGHHKQAGDDGRF